MTLKLPKRLQHGKKVTNTRFKQQEKSRTERYGAKPVAGSGRFDEKGDVRLTGVMRLECKNTTAKSFSITKKMIQAIEDAACSSDEIPAIEVEFVDDNGKLLHRVAVIPDYALETLIDNQTEKNATT